MPTQDTLVAIDFGAGIDQRVDEKRVVPTNLVDLQNARLEKGKRISKRYAMRLLTDFKNPVGGTQLTADVLNTLGPLVLARPKASSNLDRVWTQRETDNSTTLTAAQGGYNGSIANVEISQILSATADENVIVCDAAVYNDFSCYATSSSVGVRFVILNNVTGANVVMQVGGLGTCKQPRVMKSAAGGFVLGFINSGNSLEFRYVHPNTDDTMPTAAVSTVTLVSTTQPVWDWATISGTICFCYNSSTATTIRYGIVSSTGTASAAGSFATGGVVNAIAMADNSVAQASDDARIVWHDATTGLNLRYFNSATMAAGTSFGGANRLINATTTQVENIAAIQRSSGNCIVVAQYTAATTDRRFCIMRSFADAAAPAPSAITQRAVGLASKIVLYNGKFLGLTVFSTPTQAQYFVTNWAAYAGASGTSSTDFCPVAARFLLGDCGGLTSVPHLPQISLTAHGNGTNVYSVPVLRIGRIFAQGVAFQTIRYLAEAQLTLDDARSSQVQAQDTLMLGAGFLGEYDHGWGPIEHGFFMGPELSTGTAITSAGSLADGTYQHVAFYEWTDRKGKLHRSSVSPAITTTLSGGGGAGRITVAVPNLRVTYKDAVLNFGRTNEATVRIVLCRTDNGGKVFYRVNGTPATANNPTSDTVTINDTMSNATLITQEIAYTVAEVGNFTPNGTQAMCRTPDRVFVADGPTIYFSKPFQDGVAVAFAQEFAITLPTEGGPITAMSYMDGRIYAWKRAEVWSFTGDGPDATGAGASFSVPERLKIDGGCISQFALVDVPGGIIVQTTHGFYQLGRDESWLYIGQSVRDYNTAECIASQIFYERKEVRFLLNGSATVTTGTRLTYNYEFVGEDGVGQWSRSTFYAKDSAIVRTDGENLNLNDIARASEFYYEINQSNSNVYFEDRSQFSDETVGAYALTLTTAHIMSSQIQGFERIKRFMLVGNRKSDSTILVELAFDFEAFTESWSYAVSATTSSNGVFQFVIQPKRQKCESIQARITVTAAGEGCELVSMTMRIGLMPQLKPMPTNRKAV